MEEYPTFIIDINGDRVEYVIAETSAPKAYDGFGTITVEDASVRLIIIQKKNFLWQSQRYGSGMRFCRPCNVPGIEDTVRRKLLERLMGDE